MSTERKADARRGWPAVFPVAILVLVVLVPLPALAQGMAIQHDELSCIVAEKFPRLTACFSPRSRVARARVYFRADGTLHWYYVDMASDAPCFRGVLPKPMRSIHRMNYYVEVTDRSFVEARTLEYAPEVVPDESSCRKGLLAPFLHKATVVVGSASGAAAIPQGFLGAGIVGAGVGASTGLIVGVVGGGAAVVGGIAAGGGGGGDTSPGSSPGGGSAPPPTTTSAPGAPPPSGTPTTTLPGSPTTTTLPGAPTTTTLPGTPTTTLPPTTTTTSTTTTTTTTTSTTMPSACVNNDNWAPNVAITSPPNDSQWNTSPISFTATATDPGPISSGVQVVKFFWDIGGPRILFASVSSTCGPSTYCATLGYSPLVCKDQLTITVEAVDYCGNAATSASIKVKRSKPCFLFNSVEDSAPALSWASTLEVPGARAQIVLNGTDAVFPGPGRAPVAARARRGENRIEAVLVQGEGKPGAWQFDFTGTGMVPGSLRVVAGEVARVGPTSIAFRLKGRAGERLVFLFGVD